MSLPEKWEIKKIELPPEDASIDDLLEYLGRIASTCSGTTLTRERAIKVGKRTFSEAAGGTPSKVWEYLPMKGSFKYQNARGLAKIYSVESIQSLIEHLGTYSPENFFVFKCKVPEFVWTHIATHRSNSPLKKSARFGADIEDEFWLPPFENGNADMQEFLSAMYDEFSIREFKEKMKSLYTRKEIYNRYPHEFRMAEFMICGYSHDFDNFFAERLSKKAQKETRMFAKELREFFDKEKQW